MPLKTRSCGGSAPMSSRNAADGNSMTGHKRILLLAGGVGGAKMAYGLARLVPPETLTILVNTGDDLWHYGLRICPDLDTVTYTLAGLVDREAGWGRAGDTTTVLDTLKQLGDDPWFRLGDRDLAVHLLRTQLWHQGLTLTEITRRLSSAMGVLCRVVPMADTPVATVIDTEEHGEIAFQTYFVRYRWQPRVKQVLLQGVETTRVNPETLRAIEEADIIIISPSNPWLSIHPILSVPGIREAIINQAVPRIAVTPIVAGDSVKGPLAKMLREWGHEVSARTVSEFYGEIVNGFVVDRRDEPLNRGELRSVSLDTLMTTEEKRVILAEEILNWINREYFLEKPAETPGQ